MVRPAMDHAALDPADAEAASGLPTSPETVLDQLTALGISHRTVTHPPVATVEEAKAMRGVLPGAHIKNLFLRDKKERMWLVTVLEHRRVDLKGLAGRLGAAGRLSFGSPERLFRHLGVRPGSVTPLAAINDTAGQVAVVLDGAMLSAEVVNAHPLVNTRTTLLPPDGLLAFLRHTGHEPLILDFAD